MMLSDESSAPDIGSRPRPATHGRPNISTIWRARGLFLAEAIQPHHLGAFRLGRLVLLFRDDGWRREVRNGEGGWSCGRRQVGSRRLRPGVRRLGLLA